MNVKRQFVSFMLAAGLGVWAASAARAASLQFVPNWGASGVPTNLSMYIYVPDHLAPNPPILVLLHYWGGGASGVFAEAQGGGIVAAADQYGFIMVVPQTPDCWDAGSAQSLTHDGGGQSQGIAQMVKYAISTYQADKARVYVTGTSCGGMMTETMLAVYPDIFKAGAAFSGQAVGGAWTPVTHTAQQWGNIVRAAYPGYAGRRPRVQLWHGTADGIINYSNQVESIMQWGNVLGLSTNPTTTATVTILNVTNQWVHQTWQDACGDTVLDAWSEINGPHGTDANLNAKYVIPFLALDQTGPVDPLPPCGVPAVSAYSQIEAENYDTEWSGIQNENCSEGGQDITGIQNGAYLVFQNIGFGGGASSFQVRVASTNGGNIELHLDGLTGVQIGTSVVTNTGGGQTWVTQSCPIGGAAGVHDLYLKFTGGGGSLFNVNWWRFSTNGPGLGAAPTGLAATATSPTQINLAWNAATNATGYNVKRSITSGGPYATIAGGLTATNFQDRTLSGSISYYYVVSAVIGGDETPNSAEAAASLPKLTGAIIGTAGSWGGSGNTITNVFDNNLGTFFDAPTGNGAWAGLDFGAGVSNVITQINYCPRTGFESRMVGGIFQGANQAGFGDAVTLVTVGTQPMAGAFTSASITNAGAFRYVRYLSPNGGYGNVAELEFYGYRYSVSAPPILTASPAGTNLAFSWPLLSGFSLQSTTNLMSGNWQTVTSPAPQTISNQWQIVLPAPAGPMTIFYRLLK